jgi:tRNA synthetases class I (M)
MSTAILAAVAWAYRNGARHIGHKSGSGVASGVFARCHRMAGNRVLMVSGTDEPQGLPEVDAPLASGESVVSFQRPSIAVALNRSTSAPGRLTLRLSRAPPRRGSPVATRCGSLSRTAGTRRRARAERPGASPASKSSTNPGRHDGGHPDVSPAAPAARSDDEWRLIGLHHAGGTGVPQLNQVDGTYAANEGITIDAIRGGLAHRPPGCSTL